MTLDLQDKFITLEKQVTEHEFSLRTLNDSVNKVNVTLEKIDEHLKQNIESKKDIQALQASVNENTSDIKVLNKWMWLQSGAIGVIGFLASVPLFKLLH